MRQVFIDSRLEPGASASISGDEHHHLTRSLRVKVGDALLLVDATGSRFQGKLESINRHDAVARAVESLPRQAELRELTLALCTPKAEAFDESLDAATQLGATLLQPLSSQRSQAIPASRQARWQRLVRESCCQSLRASLMPVSAPASLDTFLMQPLPGRKFIAWQGGKPLQATFGPAEALSLLVGPEGGFDPAELALAEAHGWESLSLGTGVLRVPVAVAAGLGLLQAMRHS